MKIKIHNWIALFVVLAVLAYVISIPRTNYAQSIKLGGEWFLNNQNDSFLHYQYNLSQKSHAEKSHALREMGALWSISKLANFLDDSRYDDLAQKGFKYFESHFEYDEENDFYFININPKKIKLGYSAFAILSLLEIDHPKKDFYLEKLANGIIFMQNDDGSLRTFFYSDRATGTDYYPGEALIALMSLYNYSKDERYLEVVEKAFPYYMQYFRDGPNTAFVPWQTRAYYELYLVNGTKEVADFIFEMNDYTVRKNSSSCNAFSSGIVTAVRVEGVIRAYWLAKELHDKERTKCYGNYVREGLEAVLALQIKDETTYGKEALGGFLGNPDSNILRVDRNQHAVMALMDAKDGGVQ